MASCSRPCAPVWLVGGRLFGRWPLWAQQTRMQDHCSIDQSHVTHVTQRPKINANHGVMASVCVRCLTPACLGPCGGAGPDLHQPLPVIYKTRLPTRSYSPSQLSISKRSSPLSLHQPPHQQQLLSTMSGRGKGGKGLGKGGAKRHRKVSPHPPLPGVWFFLHILARPTLSCYLSCC
jgi:hypothetical protein